MRPPANQPRKITVPDLETDNPWMWSQERRIITGLSRKRGVLGRINFRKNMLTEKEAVNERMSELKEGRTGGIKASAGKIRRVWGRGVFDSLKCQGLQ